MLINTIILPNDPAQIIYFNLSLNFFYEADLFHCLPLISIFTVHRSDNFGCAAEFVVLSRDEACPYLPLNFFHHR